MTPPRLYLVCGLPGAGKTTRARQLAARAGAVFLCADEWVVGLGRSLVDFEFRIKLQECLLAHAGELLGRELSVVLEFGSWHRQEREMIRQVAEKANATTELHFVSAPVDELVRRVRGRAGPETEALVTNVLLRDADKFEVPNPEEIARFDDYVGPDGAWPVT